MKLAVEFPSVSYREGPEAVMRLARAIERIGYDHIDIFDHVIMGIPIEGRPKGPYNPGMPILEAFMTLAYLAAVTTRVTLGTEVLVLPQRQPALVAKQVSTLDTLSGGRVRLGVGVGWHEDEFRFMGYEFAGRGRRTDEALRLMRALWGGERAFRGEHWSFTDATFALLPEPQPELWVGGGSERAIRRARELGDVWHPSGSVGPDAVKRVKERYPKLLVVPRTGADQVDAFLDAGAEGAVVSIPDEASLRDFAERYRSRTAGR